MSGRITSPGCSLALEEMCIRDSLINRRQVFIVNLTEILEAGDCFQRLQNFTAPKLSGFKHNYSFRFFARAIAYLNL